jgi:hypothetical protein
MESPASAIANPTRKPRKFSPVKLPDVAKLPADALLTRQQLVALSGFTEQAFKKWARESRGPAITVVEGRPRYRAEAVRAWLSGA